MLTVCLKLNFVPSLLKSATYIQPIVRPAVQTNLFRTFVRDGRNSVRRYADDARDAYGRVARRRQTLKERAMEPAGETAFNVGKGALAGGAALGLGALCFYGLGLSSKPGAIDRSMLWPQYVRDRIKTTYIYFGGSLALTAAAAFAAFRSPSVMRFVMNNSFMSVAVTFAAMIGSGMLVQSIPYKEGFGAKQLAWMLHSGVIGVVIAPICLIGGPLMIRAAWYTAGVVGGLSTIAVCAPSEKFLNIGGPLAIGFGVVLASSLASMFLPPTTALGAGLYSLSMYGGLLLFSGFLLYDTQRIIRAAEVYPVYAQYPFDPVNAAVSIYMDTINIFFRIAMILAGGGGKKK